MKKKEVENQVPLTGAALELIKQKRINKELKAREKKIFDEGIQKLLEMNLQAYSEFISEGMNEAEALKLIALHTMESIEQNKEFKNIVRELLSRGIMADKVMLCLYSDPAMYADTYNISNHENAENFFSKVMKFYSEKKVIDLKNYLSTHRDICEIMLDIDVDRAIRNCAGMELFYRKIKRHLSEAKRQLKEQIGWPHELGVDIKKQAFWTHSTIKALEFLESYDVPYNKNTRDKNLLIIAYCMKALYPKIWTGDVDKIKERLRIRLRHYDDKQKTEELKK